MSRSDVAGVRPPAMARRDWPARPGGRSEAAPAAPAARRAGARRRRRRGPLRRHRRELRDDLLAVRAQDLLLALGHEVDVELVDADRLQLAQLLRRLLDGAEDAEAVGDLVRHELAVRRTD